MLVELFIWVVIFFCTGYINTGGPLNTYYATLEHIPAWSMKLVEAKSSNVGRVIEVCVGYVF